MTEFLFRSLMAYMGGPVIKELSQIIVVPEFIKLILFVVCMCNRKRLNYIVKDLWFIKKYI